MDKIIVLDFGGQYCHLISRRIRNFGVYCEILTSQTTKKDLDKIPDVEGIILSGGAASVYDKKSPKLSKEILKLDIPVLGICYGHQLIAHIEKGIVAQGKKGEYGIADLKMLEKSILLSGLNKTEKIWMNHKDVVAKLPSGYSVIASTENSSIAAYQNVKKKIYGLQFHPEVTHTEKGGEILKNFVLKICNVKREWTAVNIVEDIIQESKSKIGGDRAIIGLSGGIDSSTAAVLMSKAIGKNIIAVYVDTGLMRHKETEFIKKAFSRYDLNLHIVNAKSIFFKKLKGIVAPEQKRKIIGRLFVDIFNNIARKEKANFLIQGTIYSDRIESGITQHSSKIKSHHNVGGLPKNLKLKLHEPLKDLYKDEVRELAKKLNLPDEITNRQVFPGPGLAIRIIGEVTPEKTRIVRIASFIVEDELKKADLYKKLWMSFAILLPIKSVGIQGDARSYKYPIVVRIIESKDAMTANFSKIPYKVLEKISTRITNEIPQVNRVVYDITNKPPATMEWE